MLSLTQALWLAPACVALSLWIALSDMKRMKIPNMASILMIGVWAVVGFIAFPLEQWLWGWGFMAIGLVVGILGNAIGLYGAGDAKFAAAMSGVFVTADLQYALKIIASAMVAALVTQKLAARIPAIRRATPGWESWGRRDFPFGLALAGILSFYTLAPILAAILAK